MYCICLFVLLANTVKYLSNVLENNTSTTERLDVDTCAVIVLQSVLFIFHYY